MFSKNSKDISIIILALFIFGTVEFFDVNIKQIEEVHPFEMAETGVVHNDSAESLASDQSTDFQGTEDDIISLTNEFRKEKGLDVLVKNDKLMASAKMKAEDMRDQKYFAHTSPSGVELWNLIQQVDYKYSIIAENIAEGYFSAESVVNAWMDSEGHRENILSVDLEEIGVAILEIQDENNQKNYVLVQHFATPQKEIVKEEDVQVVCEKKVKENCKKIDDKKEEYQDLVKDQKDVIDKAEGDGFSRKDLIDLYDNLDALKDVRDEYKEFSLGCEEYMNKCDRWE